VPKLFIVEGGQESVFELLGDEVTIGRGAANSVQVFDNHASKHHAVIRTLRGRPKLVDLESKNGTRVNGQFRNQRVLEHGDTVAIGSAILRYDASDVPVVTVRTPGRPAAPVGARAPAAVAAVAAAPAPPRVAPRRGRERERYVDEEGEERERPARRGPSGAGIGLMVGGGVLLLVVLMILLLSNIGGTSQNALVAQRAIALAQAKKYDQAVQLLRREGDPSDVDGYQTVARLIKKYEAERDAVGDQKREEEAAQKFKYEIWNPLVEQHKNQIPDEEFARRVKDFLVTYKGTSEAMALENSQFDPHKKVRERFLKPPPPK